MEKYVLSHRLKYLKSKNNNNNALYSPCRKTRNACNKTKRSPMPSCLKSLKTDFYNSQE